MKTILSILAVVLCLSSHAQDTGNPNLKVIWKCDVTNVDMNRLYPQGMGEDYSVFFETYSEYFWVRNNGEEIIQIPDNALNRRPDDLDFDRTGDCIYISDDLLVLISVDDLIEFTIREGELIRRSTTIGYPRNIWGTNQPQPKNPFLAKLGNELILYKYIPSGIQQVTNKKSAIFHADKTTFATEAGKNYVEFNATVTPNQTYTWSFSDDLKSWTALGELSSEDGNLWLRVENKQGQEYIKLK